MKFVKMVSAVAVACAALVAPVAAGVAVAADDVSVLVWRVVDGPYANTPDGLQTCKDDAFQYHIAHGWQTGCLLDADSNQYFVWANV
ncbi:hypothetical protein UK23_22755 [Lentzea aerocolonigenes]|uniref:Secreted protein n=1 Tax=Lentzea aerocolonigenes TaxID=68170 RepID=A0A0F0GTF1_LENAE|nr:hypothetical protein [Lentzea aerocolonigenes]KJK46754.1 hypothetical protein UK23_22755 [Lentzea aerocolonigenes]